MSAHQPYSMTAFDPRLLGIRVLDPEVVLKLTGERPAGLPPAQVADLEKGIKRFHGYSRNGWFCALVERLAGAAGIDGLGFLFETPDERKFSCPDRAYPDVDPDEYDPAVWYTLLEPDACAAAADAVGALMTWCWRNQQEAADLIECHPESVRPAVARAHTLQWWSEVGDPEEVDERYLFCVLATARDLLNCAASRRWLFLFEQEEVH